MYWVGELLTHMNVWGCKPSSFYGAFPHVHVTYAMVYNCVLISIQLVSIHFSPQDALLMKSQKIIVPFWFILVE